MSATEAHDQSGDCPDDLESVEEEETAQDMDKMMKFNNLLSTIHNQHNAEMLANLPPQMKRRVKALKVLQFETTKIEAKFFKEVHDLECKYHKLYVPMYEKRCDIVNGKYEPTEDESQWASDEEDEISNELKEKAKLDEKEKKKEPAYDENVKGIPDFWLTIFRNVSTLSSMVQIHDEPIMKHLVDIKAICREEPMGFTLEFHFSPNEYFTNTVLTKDYEMKCVPDEDEPLSFEGPEIYKCSGCVINWNKGKNITLRTVKKKQKHKSRGVVRTVTKTVKNDSFFNFFSPPAIPEDTKEEEVDDDLRHLLTSDFEIGHYIRERIIPRAVLYYTGEVLDEEEDYDEEEEELEEEDEDDDVDENKKVSKVNGDQNCKQQ